MKKKLLAIILVCVMLIGIMPLSAIPLSAETESNTNAESNQVTDDICIYTQWNADVYPHTDGGSEWHFCISGCGWCALAHAIQALKLEEKDKEEAGSTPLPYQYYQESKIKSNESITSAICWLKSKYSNLKSVEAENSTALNTALASGRVALLHYTWSKGGHYVMAIGISSDGKYVHVVDSCLNVVFNHFYSDIYYEDSTGNITKLLDSSKETDIDYRESQFYKIASLSNARWRCKSIDEGKMEKQAKSHSDYSGGDYWIPYSVADKYDETYLFVGSDSTEETTVTLTDKYLASDSSVTVYATQTVENMSLNETCYIGIHLYDESGNVLKTLSITPKQYAETVTERNMNWVIGKGCEVDYTLVNGKTYSYEIFAVVNGTEYKSERGSFTFMPSVYLEFSTFDVVDITASSAKFSYYCTVKGEKTGNISELGWELYDSAYTPLGIVYKENPSFNSSYGYFFDSNNPQQIEYELEQNTEYKIRLYIVMSGTKYWSDYKSFTTLACNHGFSGWSAEDDEIHQRVCSVCGHVETEAHTWDNGTERKAATCTETGIKVYKCVVCDAEKTETLPLIGHTYNQKNTDDKYLASAATTTSAAKYYYSCVCGAKGTETFTYGDVIPTETDKTISLGEAVGYVGKTFTMTLSLGNNEGIAGLRVGIKLPEGITVDSVTNNSSMTMTADRTYVFDGAENFTGTDVATFTFAVGETVAAGEYEIRLTVYEAMDADLDDIELCAVNGKVTVKEYVLGDVNGDDMINTKDIVLLRKYVANIDPDSGESTVAISDGSDVNEDGLINTKDIVLLRKYVANIDPDTGLSTVVLGKKS